MRAKFNKFERVAGIFVLVAIIGSGVSTVTVAVKKGWFSSKISFQTKLESADGIHAGTVVHVSGLRAGSVTSVDLVSANEVNVKFELLEKFHSKVREDSKVRILRPFIIGDKVLDVSVGSETFKVTQKNAFIQSEPSMDVMDLFSGKKLGPFLNTMEGLLGNLKVLAEAFADPKRTQDFVKIFDKMNPMFTNLSEMSSQLTFMVKNLNKVVPDAVKQAPEFGKNMEELVTHMKVLTENLSPAFEKVGPELPQASLRALEALNEAVVLLKSMQKSYFLRGHVEKVKAEESKRTPASAK